VPGELTGAVKRRGNGCVWHLTGQYLYQFDDIDVGGPPRLTGLVFRDLQASVISALPVDHQSDLVIKDIHNDLRDQEADDFLARLDGDAGTAPRS